MAYEFKKMMADPGNFGGSRTADTIRFIVVHYTGNDGDRAESNARYFQTPGRGASAHYFIDSKNVIQSVDDLVVAWSVGGVRYDDCGRTGGGKLHGVATNANTLNVEICDDIKDGKVEPSRMTLRNTVDFVRELMDRYQIPSDRVIRHFDVTGKRCPAYFVNQFAWRNFICAIESRV